MDFTPGVLWYFTLTPRPQHVLQEKNIIVFYNVVQYSWIEARRNRTPINIYLSTRKWLMRFTMHVNEESRDKTVILDSKWFQAAVATIKVNWCDRKRISSYSQQYKRNRYQEPTNLRPRNEFVLNLHNGMQFRLVSCSRQTQR